jgi:CRISP-associated protein Cas1
MGLLKGRLGLETARIPHADRHGLLWLSRGKLYVEDGTLRFATAGSGEMQPGDYAIPFQSISNILLGPGGSVTHDALRLFARHGCGLIVVGEGGVRFYASMPLGADDSTLARQQIEAWADVQGRRLDIARKMYAWRLGEIFPHTDIAVLRGIEGARMKTIYEMLSRQYGVEWKGRRYDRQNPESADLPNQAINHAATAVEAAAMIAVASTSTLPQIGFIHEHSSNAFCLDIADLFRDSITIPGAFAAVGEFLKKKPPSLDSVVRVRLGRVLHEKQVIPKMIDRIKDLFNEHDSGRNC